MDQLSSLYVRMASGAHSQLHNPASVMGFVDQMQSRVEKSSAPRKSFLIDPATPHSDVVIAESSALKQSVGWVTLQVTEGIRRGIHEWGIKVEHQGESNDESGLMLGILPKSFSKYDTFISQGGGWCLSRAGKFYGHWRRTDTGGGALTFGTGDRVVLTLDYEAAVMTVRVGEKVVVGELSGLTMEVFPAVSLHYRHQHVRFDHHAIREASSQHLPWRQRQTFPLAPAYMPLSFPDVQNLPLNSYLFSSLFQNCLSLEGSSAITMEEDRNATNTVPGAASAASLHELLEKERAEHAAMTTAPAEATAAITREKEQRAMRLYLSAEASAARLTVLSRAFAAVRRYVAVQPGTSSFLSPHVTAEYLRKRLYEAARESALRAGSQSGALCVSAANSVSAFSMGGNPASPSSSSSSGGVTGGGGYDAALNCGAVIVVHLFVQAVSSGQGVAAPLVVSFRDFILSLPIFSLVEGGAGGSVLAPDTVQLAVDHIVRLLDASTDLSDSAAAAARPATTTATASSKQPKTRQDGQGDAPVSTCTAALLEVAMLLALQRGLVSEVLRVCRYLLRVPAGTLSPALVAWLRRHTTELAPRQPLPDVGHALKRACEDPASFTPTQIDPSTVVLAVAYGAGCATLYLHTADGLSKWGPSAATPYVLLVDTRLPAPYCTGASRSSMAVTHTHVLLLTDRMASEEVALVLYSLQLDQHQVLRWADMHSSWPRSPRASPQLATMSGDGVLLLFERSAPAPASVRTANGAAAVAGTPASAVASGRGGRRLVDSTPLAVPSPPYGAPAAAPPLLSVEWEVVVLGYSAATAAALSGPPLWTRTLQPPPPISASGVRLDRCLLLRKPSLVDLGSPEEHLTVVGGHVTVELWVQFLDKEDAATLYQHGDRSTNGEVFLELIRWEGSHCIRGGYRHDVRGSCLVSAPLPPTAESRPLHVGLVFNGRWRLFFDGEEVAGNRQGSHVALDAPKQRWTVGAGCTCLLTGLRVWRLGRTARELSRDFRRSLAGDEPGLVAQFFFNERGGNVALNYVHQVKASHAVCSGGFAHVPCATHPWRHYGTSSVAAVASASIESAANPGTAAASLACDSTPACGRLHEWRDLTLTTCCVVRHVLLLSTPVGDSSPYPSKEGGRALMFFDLASGVAHRSLFFLTSRSPVRHWMRADPAGRLWELFEVDASLVKGEQEASYLVSLLNATGSSPQRPRERILAVVPLPLEEEEDAERLCTFVEDDSAFVEVEHADAVMAAASPSLDRRTSSNSSSSTAATAATGAAQCGPVVASTPAEPDQFHSQLSSFAALVAQPGATVSYSTVALWLLKLLAAHADADPDADQALFTPLADDVSSRCVTEVRVILCEHVRVVRANNARRAVALRSSLSWVVVAVALRVLLRLIRRARAFGLHPGPLKLTVVKKNGEGEELVNGEKGLPRLAQGEEAAAASEATMSLLLRELHTSSLRRRTAPSPAHDGPDNADSSTLLGLLADVINEDGLTLPTVVVTLARTVTVEGVGLFLPDVRQRAKLLRDMLRASSPLCASPLASAASLRSQRRNSDAGDKNTGGGDGGASSSSRPSKTVDEAAEERVPAMNVLLDAVAQSFTTVLAAAPLLCVEDGVASLSDVCDTLRTLLQESAVQWRRKWSVASTPSPLVSSTTTSNTEFTATAALHVAAAVVVARPSNSFHSFAFSLSEAIASLQLLLLSACQGNRWEVALTEMHASAGGATSGGGGGGGGNNGGRAVGAGAANSSAGDNNSNGGGNNGGWSTQSYMGGLAGARDAISAAALDLQHLCFSQAASHHPCVRLHYSALFTSAASCLALCVEAQQQEEEEQQQQSDAVAAKRASLLPAMVASLAPTFLTAPLHTALSAIPLVLTVEDGEWFQAELGQLLRLSEKLLGTLSASMTSDNSGGVNVAVPREFSNDGGASVAAARRLLSSLRESLYYASVWVAAFLFNCSTVSSSSVKEEQVRQRLGLASVTATPTAQRTVTNLTAILDCAPAEPSMAPSSSTLRRTAAAEAEAAAVWEQPLLEGGIWPQDAGADAEQNPTSDAGRRRGAYMAHLVHNTAYWSAKQAAFDHLGSKASSAMAPLITLMAAAALHLSSLPLPSLTAAQVEKLMCGVMRQLSRPVRTELLSRREGEGDHVGDTNGGGEATLTTPLSALSPVSRQRALDAMLKELQQRCELLLRVRTCSEVWDVEDALFMQPTCDAETASEASLHVERGSAPPQQQQRRTCAKRKLQEAWHAYELRRMRYRAHVASRPSCTLHEAVQLVKHVILSRATTAASLRAALRQRESLAALREAGIDRLVQLVMRAPCSAESVAQLLSAQGRGAESHFEDGLRGGGHGYVARIRSALYELLSYAAAPAPDQRSNRAGVSLSLVSSATVLCGLLDRAWQPRDFAFFVQLRVVPALVECYLTLFKSRAEPARVVGTSNARCGGGERSGERRSSHVGGSTTPASPRRHSATGAVPRARSVELRPIALTERRHRDEVVTAQQARRSSKSTLVSAAVLRGQSVAGEGGVAGNGGGADGPLQYTANEAMQAKVWLTVKNLMLQSTAMLTATQLSSMSRVEQTAVMAFLADALRAVGAELQHCRDVLARAVIDTPVLLAQAGDAAVLEPLVTVQDQVDLLCSLLSVVAGTLSSPTAAFKEQPSMTNAGERKDDAADGAMFLNGALGTVCAGVAETLLELVALDVHHARVVRNEAGVGCVVRDAAACARIAGLLLCRCQPVAIRCFASTTTESSFVPASPFSAWNAIYASPVFTAVPRAASSGDKGGHTCIQRWLDLCTYAVATTGLSRTAQHVLLTLRRLLHQPAWAAELRGFAAAYKCLVLTYVKLIQVGDGEEEEKGQSSGGSTRVRELSAVQLYVWVVVLGGQLLAPPVDLGMVVSYLDEKDGFQPTLAYVVDVESVSVSTTSTTNALTAAAPQAAASTSRHVRGASHLPSKLAAAMAGDGERVRSVVAVPIDPSSGCSREAEEVSLSPHQLFLPAWEAPVVVAVVPPYANLVEDFLMPALQHSVPLLFEKLHGAASFSSMELLVFTSLLQLTAGVMRARPDLARRLIEHGALPSIRQHALQGVVRLPFPLKVLKEWAALVAVRSAEEVAERIYTPEEEGRRGGAEQAGDAGDAGDAEVRERGEGRRQGRTARSNTTPVSGSPLPASRSATPTAAATTTPATLRTPAGFANENSGSISNSPLTVGGGGASAGRPVYTSLSAPLAPLPGSGEALLDTFRSGGLSASSTAVFLPGGGGGGYVVGNSASATASSAGAHLTAPSALTRDIASDYGLLRLARSFGVFAGAYGGVPSSSSMSAALGNARSSPGALLASATPTPTMNTGGNPSSLTDGSGTPAPARIPPRTELGTNGGAPMFLSFPMWDAHPLSSAAPSSHTPAAVTITPSRPEVRFPVWDDGFAIETAVLLNDGDVYPAIGDSLSIPCSWARVSASDYEEDSVPPASPSPFEFPLVTLYAAVEPTVATGKLLPFIQIKVHRGCLSATITFPRTNAGDHGGPETVFVTKAMRREDWHHCMHVSLMCNASCVTLCRNGEAANVELRGDVGRRLETLLRQDGFIRAVVLGRHAAAVVGADAPVSLHDIRDSSSGGCATPVRELDGPMALLGGLRIWGTSVLRTSVRVVAELVARDHALQPFGLPEHLCFFEMKEGSGGVVHSADTSQQYRGMLSGGVRWSIEPLPLGFYPSIELNSGRARSGVSTPPVSSTSLPRSTMSALIQSLSPLFFSRFAGDVMWSLLSMTARHATVTALEVGMSPAYELRCLSDKSAARRLARPRCFDPRQVLDPNQKLPYQLYRLFQLQDSGCLPNKYERLIHGVVQRLVTVLAAEEGGDGGNDKANEDTPSTQRAAKTEATRSAPLINPHGAKPSANPTAAATPAVIGTSSLTTFVGDTALLLRQLRRDDGEMFVMELPPARGPSAATVPATAASSAALNAAQGAAILPISLTNGGTGVLSFDTKYRNMEQAMLYKDEELKNILAKYPDGQGGWPAYTLTASAAPWAYLRSVSSSAAGHRLTMNGKTSEALTSSILTVTVKSLKPVILHAAVRALCDALRGLPTRQRRDERRRGSNTERGSLLPVVAAGLLDARVVASLIQQSSARSSDDDCAHFVRILTDLLQLWRCVPRVSPHDQLPLAMAMSHLNLPLCSIVQRQSSDADLGSLLSTTTGTYSPYVQALVGLWATAIQVDCEWAGRTYAEQLRARWRRLLRTWRRSAVHRPAASRLPPRKTSSNAPSQPTTGRVTGLTATETSRGRQGPQLYTPPSSPNMRAQVRTAAALSTDAPFAPESEPGKARQQRGEEVAGEMRDSAPPAVELVAMEPPAGSPGSPSSPTNSEGARHDVAVRRDRCPKGVARKGNGLWVVKGGSGSSGSTAEGAQDDPARNSGGGGGVSGRSGGATTVRSSVGFTSGAVYWEVYVTNISRSEHPPSLTNGSTLASNVLVGVATERCTPMFSLSGPDGAGVFLGNDSESWAFDGGRALRYYKGCCLESGPRTKWKMDDVIGFVLDIARNRLCCSHNGRLVAEFNGSFLSPQQRAEQVALFPVIICAGEGSCEVNFGATGFASSPPPGCLPVDPSLYVSEEAARVWQLVLAEELLTPRGPGALSRMNTRGTTNSTVAAAAEEAEEEEKTAESNDLIAFVGNDGAERGVSSRRARILAHPALPHLCRHVAAYSKGRFGPLDVVLLCPDGNAKTVSSRECKTDKESSLLLGSVAVTSGRWYFEVVLPGEPTFHVGWYAWRALEEQGDGGNGAATTALNPDTPATAFLASPNGRAQLGHDAFSWSLDAARMAVRHNKQQRTLARRAWKCGDVVGCLLDCDAGSVAFTVNGEALVETHGGATIFSGRSPPHTPPPLLSTSPHQQTASAPTSPLRVQPERRPSNTSGAVAATEAPCNTPAALFTGISMSETRGLVPAILLEPKSALGCLWNADELLYPPQDGSYRALGGAHVVRNALVQLITQTSTDVSGSVTANGGGGSNRGEEKWRAPRAVQTAAAPSRWLNTAALQELLYYASKVQELCPTSLRSYTMPSLFNVPRMESPGAAAEDDATSTDGPQSPSRKLSQQQQQQDLCSASGLDVPQLHTHLAALLFFAHLFTFLYPFAHAASLPFMVEDTPLGSNWAMTNLHRTLNQCRAFAPPWTALRVLQWSLDASNGAGDAVRLSVNRRKALTVVRDPSASITRRLRDSLFGQVYQLLSTKAAVLFTTNKKMWTVAFYGEGADDVGGPYRECLTQMCTELMSGSLTLFLPSANMANELGEVRDAFVVNPVCAPPVELLMYRFLGRLMGGCLRGGEPLSLYLPSALWKYLVGEAADDTDMARVDVATLHAIEYVERIAGTTGASKAVLSMTDEEVAERNAELVELCPGGFSLLNDAGVEEELVPGGDQVPLTVHNASLYVRLVREQKLYGSGAAQRRALQQGFHEVVPLCSVAGLKWYELEELVCGQCDYDPDALLDTARFDGLEASDVRIAFLRAVLRGFTRHQRALFMRFVSGRERLPPGIRLKIMPDDAPRGGASIAPLTPRVPPVIANATAAAGVMTPQPPPPQTSGEGGHHDHSSGRSGSGGSGNNTRNGTFARHNVLQQQSGLSGSSQPPPPPPQPSFSPPQLGFTPPPPQSMPLPPGLARAIPPPVLQPRQLLSGQRGANAPSLLTSSPPARPTRHTVPDAQQLSGNPAQDADLATCDDARLPHASTCFYWLRLPRYSSAAVMAEKLLFAIEQCVDIDADFRVHDTDVAEQEAGPSLARVSSDEDDLFEDFSHLR
ncbi:hypothetical protein ABB37_07709 [Leptomonas pyrrhocoris]|uniref:Ubiquitin-protein ligase n=1 Tax=Leptomonas pyrrhocoris TaxID=157538 RepID=A0A0N0DSP2_LEPPY|nr:hypothetical protein ABB37_07709 [Leptomonas pyrrhocoris]KPA76362.1 hypothetical protein ABB37_07709 [Leptomonas pyrrhocoris]|eukprot:XP_015654801.1 hypothetical protein ABB37_07709 [Leptomonas pyrrhocoris]